MNEERPARKAEKQEQPIGREKAKALTLDDLRHKIELDSSKGEFGPSLQLVLRTPEKKLVAIHHFRVPKLNRNKGEYFHGLTYP